MATLEPQLREQLQSALVQIDSGLQAATEGRGIAVYLTHGGVRGRQAGQILEGSFSALSTPLIARIGLFFSIFRALQDLYTFAPLKT